MGTFSHERWGQMETVEQIVFSLKIRLILTFDLLYGIF